MDKKSIYLVVGDILVLSLVTLVGFASHNELGSTGLRVLTTFLPLLAAWFLVAPHLGVYRLELAQEPRQLWRPFWAMVLAGPMAGFLRGVMLNDLVAPLFVVILGGVSALAILGWRWIYTSTVHWLEAKYG